MKILSCTVAFLSLLGSVSASSSDWSTLKIYSPHDFSMWKPVMRSAPTYPQKAAQKHIEGCVNIYFDIDSNGHPGTAKVVKSSPEGLFEESALQALSGFRYQPSEANSKRAPVITNNIFIFAASENEETRQKLHETCSRI